MSLKKSNIRPKTSESSEELNFEDRKNDRRVSWGLMRIREYTASLEDSEHSPAQQMMLRPKIPMIEPTDLYTAPIESPSTGSNVLNTESKTEPNRESIMDVSESFSPRSESPVRFLKGMDLIQEFNKIGENEMPQDLRYNPILTPVIEENDAMQICSTDDSSQLICSTNPNQQLIQSTPSSIPILRYTPNFSASRVTSRLSSAIPESSSRPLYTSLIEKNKLTPLKPISCNIFTSHRLTPSKKNLFSYTEDMDFLKAELQNCTRIANEIESQKEAVFSYNKSKQDEYNQQYRQFKDFLVDYVNQRASITEQFPSRLTDESGRMEDSWFGDCRWNLINEQDSIRIFKLTDPINSCFMKGSFYLKICAGSVAIYHECPHNHVLLSCMWDNYRCYIEDLVQGKPQHMILDTASRSIQSLVNLIESYEQLIRFSSVDKMSAGSEFLELSGRWGSGVWEVKLNFRNLDVDGGLCIYVIKQLTT